MRVRPVSIPNTYKLSNCRAQNVSEINLNSGIFELQSAAPTKMSLKEFHDIATVSVGKYRAHVNDEFGVPVEELSSNDVASLFWNELSSPERPIPQYAVDNEISRLPDRCKWWNLNKLAPAVSGLSSASNKMPCINTPYTYCAMPHASFALHHEDSNCGSINIHHGGAARIWYSIPSSNTGKLEKVFYFFFRRREPFILLNILPFVIFCQFFH